jgi:ribonuclease HI
VTLCWVKGHSGDEENERCNQLSQQAAQAEDLPADEGYENRETLAVVCSQPSLFDQAG